MTMHQKLPPTLALIVLGALCVGVVATSSTLVAASSTPPEPARWAASN